MTILQRKPHNNDCKEKINSFAIKNNQANELFYEFIFLLRMMYVYIPNIIPQYILVFFRLLYKEVSYPHTKLTQP